MDIQFFYEFHVFTLIYFFWIINILVEIITLQYYKKIVLLHEVLKVFFFVLAQGLLQLAPPLCLSNTLKKKLSYVEEFLI
jgi:hypothetical protein